MDIAKMLKKALRIQVSVGIATVTGSNDTDLPVFVAPCAGRFLKLGYIPGANITGDNTNNMTAGFKDKGADGNGTDIMAQKVYETGIDATDFNFEDLGTVSYRDLVKGDVITFFKVHSGTGLDLPACVAIVEFQADLAHGD